MNGFIRASYLHVRWIILLSTVIITTISITYIQCNNGLRGSFDNCDNAINYDWVTRVLSVAIWYIWGLKS
jgi:hypothetical protein